MFNRRISDDLAAAREIVQVAVSASRVPGQTVSLGNAAGAIGTVSNAVPVGVLISGVDGEGNGSFAFLMDVDRMDDAAVRLG